MTWQRIDSTQPHRLVYRNGPATVVGPILVLVGGVTAFGTAQRLFQQWPQFNQAYFLGVLVSVGIIAWGADLLSVRQIVIDRNAGLISCSRGLGFWRSHRTYDLAGCESVAWHHCRANEKSRFQITLDGPAREPIMLLELQLAADTHRMAAEIAEFLGWQCTHWDDDLLTAANRQAADGHRGTAATVHALVGRQPLLRMKTGSPDELVFAQSFETLLRSFGLVALVTGSVVVAGFLLGIPLGAGQQQTGWLLTAILALLCPIGILFLLGRRGITFDKQSVAFWLGLPMPLWIRRCPLADVCSVALEPTISESAGHPGVRWNVALQRRSGETVVVVRSPLRDEAQATAVQIAAFLRCEFTEGSQGRALDYDH